MAGHGGNPFSFCFFVLLLFNDTAVIWLAVEGKPLTSTNVSLIARVARLVAKVDFFATTTTLPPFCMRENLVGIEWCQTHKMISHSLPQVNHCKLHTTPAKPIPEGDGGREINRYTFTKRNVRTARNYASHGAAASPEKRVPLAKKEVF